MQRPWLGISLLLVPIMCVNTAWSGEDISKLGFALQLGAKKVETLCLNSNTPFYQNVADYNGKKGDGTAGPAADFVNQEAPSTFLLQWNRFDGLGLSDPLNLGGRGHCTATLIGKDQAITAGHCFSTFIHQLARNGVPLTPSEAAKLMTAKFNYQYRKGQAKKNKFETVQVFAVTGIAEGKIPANGQERIAEYAIITLAKDDSGRLPGDKFPVADWDASVDAARKAKTLIVIQHPKGAPKVVMVGSTKEFESVGNTEFITYNDIDTLGGSSGSGIIAESGKLVGIHTLGGCNPATANSHNAGVPLFEVAKTSGIIK